jgi:hypothetical protein
LRLRIFDGPFTFHRAGRPWKPATSSPEDLRARGFEPPEYRYLREAAVNRVIPAHQINNIWHYQPDDLTDIENALRQARAAAPVAA